MKIKVFSTLLLLLVVSMAIAQEFNKKNVNLGEFKSHKMDEVPKKVYLKNFKVFYQMIAEGERTVHGGRQFGGGAYKGDATARMAVGVDGIDPEMLQTLTNELYNEYVTALKAAGLEVYTSKDIGKIEFFEGWELLEGPRINEEQIRGSLMVIPEGFSYYVKGVKKGGKEKTGGFMAGVTQDDGGFASAAYGPVPRISEQLDDMIVTEVVLNVPSIYIKSIRGVLGSSAKVKGGAFLRLQNGRITYASGRYRKIGVPSPSSFIELTVTKPVFIPNVFGEQDFKAVATKNKTTVPSYASYFTVENKTVELTNTITCDGEDYKREVKKAAKAYLDLSIKQLQKGLSGEKSKRLD